MEGFDGFGGAELGNVIEDKAGELSLLLAIAVTVGQNGEQSVHKFEVSEAVAFHAFGFISQNSEDLKYGFAYFG